jgi:hypothetical protein
MKVYLLEKYNPDRDFENTTILNVFSTKEKAQEWLNHYIRDEYDIEDDFDGDLQEEIYPVEFTINSYQVF